MNGRKPRRFLKRRVKHGHEEFLCVDCETWKPRHSFTESKKGWGVLSACRPCMCERQKRSYWKDPEKSRRRLRDRKTLERQSGNHLKIQQRDWYAKRRGLVPPAERTWGKSFLYRCCRKCREISRPHHGRGLCTRCYPQERKAGRLKHWPPRNENDKHTA